MYRLPQQLIPGSHRLDYTRPPTAETKNHRPPWPVDFDMETVRLTPGDCLIFSERLLHATVPYAGRDQRRTLFYKYMPRDVERASVPERRYYDLTADGLTDAQKYILGWPEEWAAHGLVDDDESNTNAVVDQLRTRSSEAAAKL